MDMVAPKVSKKLNNFKQILLQKKQEIIKNYDRPPEDIDAEGDEIDLVQGIVLKAISDKISERDKSYLKRLEAALLKIEDGGYGECEDCGEKIAEKRLKAIPDCTFCVECAEMQEKIAKQYR